MSEFKLTFLHFKQHYTHFYIIFHLHVFQKITNNNSQTTLPKYSLSFQGKKKNHIKSKMNFLKLSANFFTMTKRFRSTMQKLMSPIVDLGRGFHGRVCHLGVADWVRWLRTLRLLLVGLGIGDCLVVE